MDLCWLSKMKKKSVNLSKTVLSSTEIGSESKMNSKILRLSILVLQKVAMKTRSTLEVVWRVVKKKFYFKQTKEIKFFST